MMKFSHGCIHCLQGTGALKAAAPPQSGRRRTCCRRGLQHDVIGIFRVVAGRDGRADESFNFRALTRRIEVEVMPQLVLGM